MPKKVGNVVFFTPNCTLEFQELLQPGTARYILLTYVPQTTVYILNQSDSHTHLLKKLGYGFGDKLLDSMHPIVYR